jgi:hypothetical protein
MRHGAPQQGEPNVFFLRVAPMSAATASNSGAVKSPNGRIKASAIATLTPNRPTRRIRFTAGRLVAFSPN